MKKSSMLGLAGSLITLFPSEARAAEACRGSYYLHSEGAYCIDHERVHWAKAQDLPVNWDQAGRMCREMSLGGFHDWRLPSFAELSYLARLQPQEAFTGLDNFIFSSEAMGDLVSVLYLPSSERIALHKDKNGIAMCARQKKPVEAQAIRPQRASAVAIPAIIAKYEAAKETYADYYEHAVLPLAKDLKPTYACQVWSMGTGDLTRTQLSIKPADIDGKLAHLEFQNNDRQRLQAFMLLRSPLGWRGSSDKADEQRQIDAESLYRQLQRYPPPLGAFDFAYRHPLKDVLARTFDSACVTGKQGPDGGVSELFLEMGTKSDLLLTDMEDKALLTDVIGIGYRNSVDDFFGITKVEKLILGNMDGNHSLPDSPCFSSLAAPNLVYRMKYFGICLPQ